MAWSTDQENARMLLDIPSPMNNVINDQLTLKLFDIYFDNTLLSKSLLCFSKIWKTDYLKIAKIWIVKF